MYFRMYIFFQKKFYSDLSTKNFFNPLSVVLKNSHWTFYGGSNRDSSLSELETTNLLFKINLYQNFRTQKSDKEGDFNGLFTFMYK